ncbi:hypothetical protein [Pararhodobacter marinus]|uniref:DUF4410 domain-containing protein n=1 Tax=Pararhodobacter marinus TaxID=2184063 RepID=A0A2U2C421_9RHOB|nr:hypothetical protein [Pararhodobacter marinus]PWE26636.1 hypothetical protein C4N9_21295 [Pararhodobacter marinus]
MALTRTLLKILAPLGVAGLLAACSASGANLGATRAELGDFRLCYNIVTTNDAVRGPLSREADVEVFADRIRDEVERRFGRYEGDRLYHIALHLDAYVLAVPGIPLVASPRSALILSANVWDDQLGRPLNEEPEQLTVLESAGASAVVGSGLTMGIEEQMDMLSQNAARSIEDWLVQHPEWFEHDAGATADATGAMAADPAADLEPGAPVAPPGTGVALAAADGATGDAAARPANSCGRL